MKKPFRDITEKLETHRDNLPHWQLGGSTYFVTFRSARGALPDEALKLVKVWQDESYDRILRDEKEYWEKVNYMLWNPVKAGLTDVPCKYPHLLNPMNIVT